MAEGGRSTPSFHTMQSPQVGGGCASSFFQLFQRNSSKRRFSLTSKRLPADGSDKFSRRGRSLKPEEEDRHQPVPAAAAAPAAQLLTDEEGKRKGFPMPVAAENAQKTTSSDSRAPSPMVVCNKKVPGVVARLMGLESLPLGGIAYPRTSKNIKSITSVDTVVSSSASYIDERRDEQQQNSESRPAAMIMMLHEFLAHDDLKSSKQSSLKAKHLGGFGKKLEVGQQQERCQDAGKKDTTRQKKSSQRWSKESELSIHQDTSSRGAWDIVQQQQQPPLPERKDEKQLSIVSSHRSSSSPRQLCPALLPSKSHNQIITPSPLRSPSAHKGTARLLEAAAKILEPNMQPCIRPHRASSSPSSSHGRKPSPSPPPPPIVHSAVVGDPRGKNGISSRSGERVVVVASETAARKARNTGYNSTASLSNNSSISKDLRGQAMSRTWNGRDEKEVNSAQVDVSSRFNGGSVSFRESSCRYDHHVGSIRGRRVDCVVLGNQLPSLSPPVNQHCRRSKAISNTKTGDSPEVNRPSSAIPKNKDATASVQKSKAESRINSYGCSIKASSEKPPFAITASSSSSATTPDEGNARHHQERSSMSKFSFDNQESVTTTTSTADFADSTEVPEPISPQVPVPSVPSSISPSQMLPPSNARNGKADQRRPIENPVVVVSSVPNTLFASSELPSQSTSKSRSKDEVLTRDMQQQQQPSRSLLASPTEEATIPCQTVTLPNNRKPAPNGGKRATKVLSEKLVKLDKEAIFPKHRVFPAVESAAKANSSSAHGAQRQQGQGAHDRCAAFLETQENAHRKQGVAAGMRMISYSKLFDVHVDKDRTAASKKAVVVPTGAEITVRSALRRKSAPPRAPSRCSGKSIVDTMVAVNPKATMLRTTKTSTPPEIHQCNKIPDQQLLLETGDGRATEDALNQNTPVEFNGGCSAESPTDSNTDRFRGSTLDTAVISSVKFESKMSVGSIIPMHRRMRSIDEVLSELPVDSDVRACPLADTCTGDATSVSCPQKEPKMQLFTEGSDDLRIEDETEQWRRSLLLMGSISESQAYTNMVDSAHDLFVSGDCLETGTWSTPSVAGGSADCTPERHKHTLHSSTTGEEEASEGLTPILHKWFLESSNGSAMGIGEGEQPSPVSILDSPFQDEVSITPEPSLAESDRHVDEVLELHNMCGVLGIQPSSQLDEIDVVKARDTQQESSKHSGGSNLLTEEIADIRENEKIRQAILEISKFQTADLHDRLGKSQPARADEEQSFVHGILKAAQFLSHNNEEESSLKWFAPGLPLDPSLFDRLESGDTEQISIGAGGGGGGGNLNLAQMSTHCQYGALWRCDRKLLFDSINEALATEIGYGGEPKQPWMVNDNILVGPNPTLRPPGGCSNKLVEDIYRTISKWRELASNAIDSLIDMDMNKCCRLGKWRYYEHEIRDISLEIASMLLGMILDEFVTDLAAAPAATSLLENWQAS
jgi:hypothetical protein